MATQEMINKAKLTLRLTKNAYDSQIGDLIDTAFVDMQIAGVEIPENLTPIVETAALTYVSMKFGEPDKYDELKKSYDEQKAQLATFTGYTDWGDE